MPHLSVRFWLAVVALVASAIPILHTLRHWDSLGPPVTITVRGLGPDRQVLEGSRAKLLARIRGEWRAIPAIQPGSPEWETPGVWLTGLRVAIPRSEVGRFETLQVEIAKVQHDFPREKWAPLAVPDASDPSTDLYEFPDTVRTGTSEWEEFRAIRNWRSDGAVCLDLLARSGLFLGVVWFLVARWTGLSGWAFRFLTENRPGVSAGRWWEVAGVAVLVAGIATLEIRQPFYFTQDDVMVAELPVVVYGMRSIWDGHFPEYNPVIYLGGPLASVGMFQLTYPPTFLAYAIARHLLGNEYLTGEVYAILHLLAGYGIVRLLAGRLGMGRPAAVLVTLTFLLSGSIILIGRSWSGSLGNAVWLPALMLALRTLATHPVGWRWVFGTGLVIGLYFHQGFTQNAAFSCGFLLAGAVYLAICRAIPVRRALLVIPALLVGGGLATPLLYNQMLLMGTTVRGYSAVGEVTAHLLAFVLPYPLVEFEHPMRWGNLDSHRMGHMLFAGGLLIPLCLVEVVLFVAGLSLDRRLWAGRVWLGLAGLAFLFILGEDGGLWQIGKELSFVQSLFRYPFRLLQAFVLFSSLAGGLMLDRLLRVIPWERTVSVVVAVLAVSVLGYHVFQLTPAQYNYSFRPYPPIPEELRPVVEDAEGGRYRFLPRYPERSTRTDYALGLPHNLPMLFNLPTFDGYSPLNDTTTFMSIRDKIATSPPDRCAELVRRYGIRWVVHGKPIHEADWKDKGLYGDRNHATGELLRPSLRVVRTGESVEVSELTGADPLGFAASAPGRPLPVKFGGFGVDVEVDEVPAGEAVIANFVWYPTIRTYLDGEPVPCEADEFHRIRVELPRPGKHLAVRMEPPWGKGIAMGLGFLLAGGVLVLPLVWRRPVGKFDG